MASCREIWYNGITIAAGTGDTLTATIAANSVPSTKTNYPVLLHLDATVGAEAIFQFCSNYKRIYVKDGVTNLEIKISEWDIIDEVCRIWVTIPSLTTASKVLTIDYAIDNADNPDSVFLDTLGLSNIDPGDWIMEFLVREDGDEITFDLPEDVYIPGDYGFPEYDSTDTYSYNFTIDWGDGSSLETITTFGEKSHQYYKAGRYDIKINGVCEAFFLAYTSYYELLNIKQWGGAKFAKHGLTAAFEWAGNAQMTAIDAPDLTNTETLLYTFQGFGESQASYPGDWYQPVEFCGKINGLDKWDTSSITNMYACWSYSVHTDDLNGGVSTWDLSSATNIGSMLAHLYVTVPLDISGFDVSNVIYADWAFAQIYRNTDWHNYPDADFSCNNLDWDSVDPDWGLYGTIANGGWNSSISGWTFATSLPIRLLYFCANFSRWNNNSMNNWDMTNVWSIARMFEDNPVFNQDLSNWDTSNISDFNSLFHSTSYDDNAFNNDSLDGWDLSSAIDLSYMFSAYPGKDNSAFQGDISSWDTSNVEDFRDMFRGHTYNHDLSFLDFTSATDISGMIPYNYTGDLSSWTFPNTAGVTADRMFEAMSTVPTGVLTWNTSNFNSIAYLLLRSSVTIDLSTWNVSNVLSMEGLMEGFTGTADLTGWVTTSLNSLHSFLKDCDSFSGDLSTWDTSNVTTLREAFYGSTYNVSVNDWNTSNLEDLYYTFYNSSYNHPLTNWDVSKVDSLYRTFYNSAINQSSFDSWTPVLCTSMSYMFYNNDAFNYPIGNMSIPLVTTMDNILGSASGFDTTSYDATLIGFAGQAPNIQSGVRFGTLAKYTAGGAAETARTLLTGTYGWIINDGGSV